MPMKLEGSCRCGAVRFRCDSHTPQPYQLCYCTICRKTAGGGGHAINLAAVTQSLHVEAQPHSIGLYRPAIEDNTGHCETSAGERHFCEGCASALWLYSPEWPDLIHPFASAIDTPLPVAVSRVHMMLEFKASWVLPDVREGDAQFDLYPQESIEQWHQRNGVWIE